MALEETGDIESGNPAGVVLAQCRHRKTPRNGSVVLDLVFQNVRKWQATQRTGGYVTDDVHTGHAVVERAAQTHAQKLKLRGRRVAILGQHQPASSHITLRRRTLSLEQLDDRALDARIGDEHTASAGLQASSQECRRRSRSTQLARVQTADVIAGRRCSGAALSADERQQIAAPKPALMPTTDAQTWQPSRVRPAAQ